MEYSEAKLRYFYTVVLFENVLINTQLQSIAVIGTIFQMTNWRKCLLLILTCHDRHAIIYQFVTALPVIYDILPVGIVNEIYCTGQISCRIIYRPLRAIWIQSNPICKNPEQSESIIINHIIKLIK